MVETRSDGRKVCGAGGGGAAAAVAAAVVVVGTCKMSPVLGSIIGVGIDICICIRPGDPGDPIDCELLGL